MKKIFTSLLFMAAAMIASAQNFTVTAFGNSEPIQNGQVINCGWTEIAPGSGMHTFNPELIVKANKDLSIMVSAKGHTVGDVTAQFCGLNGDCKLLVNDESVAKTKVLKAGEEVDLLIDIAIATAPLTETLPVQVEIMGGPESISFTVNFVEEEQTAIRGISVAETAVRVQGRTLHFNAEAGADLTLYTISGQAAISRHISGQGSLNLSALPAGVYIYRAGNKTGKLILR